ncbi:MAG: aminotransferase class III-fold pyridoxal phosphate-dependent enzyme [Acidobacteria bacterium]|nr:MAG: aminotransferase class III-fold pyridoxal phosphate-dependent enzyme [Acidobacteriota bacterium]REK09272.1 MAG: aminotransferase class III-fold pyridoxal phosphate-dependent enzyme [Acidobacteriota bacterium]
MPARDRPELTVDQVAAIARERFALEGSPRPLPSTDDLVLRIGDAVLKVVAPPGGDLEALERECELMSALHARRERSAGARPDPDLPPVPEVRRSLAGSFVEAVVDDAGRRCGVRAIAWLEGDRLSSRPQGPLVLERLGAALAAVDDALSTHPPAAVAHAPWDLLRATEAINAKLGAVRDPGRCRLVERLTERFVLAYEPLCDRLRRGWIHGDANDDNVLVTADPEGVASEEAFRPSRIAGLLDFGDLVHSATVCDPAIALAYLLLDDPRHRRAAPLVVLDHFTRGYHRRLPFEEIELEVLFPLALHRLCASVVEAAEAARRLPDDEARQVTAERAWEALARLERLHPRRAEWTARHACGYETVAGGRRLVGWLRQRQKAPVLGAPLRPEQTRLLDLSLTNPDFALAARPDDEPAVTAWASELLGVDLGAEISDRAAPPRPIGWGRWDEPRLVYAGEQFGADPFARVAARLPDAAPTAEQQRTVHLGIDLFAPPGAAVHAPLDAVVWSVADNDEPFDYGGTVILEHRVALEGVDQGDEAEAAVPQARFFSLYGHLDPASLQRWRPGAEVRAGEEIGRLGDPSCNGNWTPHLHLQLILDLLEDDGAEESPQLRRGNFPGVAPASERALWLEANPDPAALLLDPASARADEAAAWRALLPPAVIEAEPVRRRRQEHVNPALSLSYRSPLLIVRGRGAHLYDHLARRYVDLVNNVCHVGHAHPRVVAAQHRQSALLNTNTRYLHPRIGAYAERLLATLPEHLEVCFFVNSGSEANDLALRLARTATGRRSVLCLEGAYHGHTEALIDVSPYKHDGRGGRGTPEHVIKLALPDPYRGRYREGDAGRYLEDLQRVLAGLEDRPPAAFIAEPILGCGGQILPPPGFLRRGFEAVRAAGGLCIADEVQTGMGRVGSHFWAFQLDGAEPDIVTAGKPIGNGHPLAAVFTTREIARAFDNGMEYFNTFGGNPVSCAVGDAVLDVIEDEGLQARARREGGHLLRLLEQLAEQHPCIGDVRGAGLFLGFELVADPVERTPHPLLAAYLVERLRERGHLLSTDGPQHDVIKIKPPMVIERSDLERTVERLDEALREIGL